MVGFAHVSIRVFDLDLAKESENDDKVQVNRQLNYVKYWPSEL